MEEVFAQARDAETVELLVDEPWRPVNVNGNGHHDALRPTLGLVPVNGHHD